MGRIYEGRVAGCAANVVGYLAAFLVSKSFTYSALGLGGMTAFRCCAISNADRLGGLTVTLLLLPEDELNDDGLLEDDDGLLDDDDENDRELDDELRPPPLLLPLPSA